MRKWKSSLLVALATAICLAQSVTDIESPKVDRVAAKLQCTCGCNLNMACTMPPWPCPECRKAKIQILGMQNQGKSEGQILDAFVAENGKQILAVTPGIGGVAGPYVALFAGLLLVGWLIRRYRRPRTAAAGAETDASVLNEYHDRIEKDMAKFD